MREVIASTADGIRLALTRTPPEGPRRAVALLTHAMMANAGYLSRFAAALAEAGVESYALDFRGHGLSGRPAPGDWSFVDLVEQDLPAAVGAVAQTAGVPPAEIVFVGHSLGGLVGVAAFGAGAAPAPRRLVLVAVNVWTLTRADLGRRAALRAFEAVTRLWGRFPARALRVGAEDEAATYVREFCAWCRRGAWPWAPALARVSAPALLVVGDGDALCRPEDARALAAPLAGPVRVRCVGRIRGDRLDPDHFGLLTDPRLAPMWAEVAEFIRQDR